MSYYAIDNQAYRDPTMASEDWGGGNPGWGMWSQGLRHSETRVGVGDDAPAPDPATASSTVPTATVWGIAAGGIVLGLVLGHFMGKGG